MDNLVNIRAALILFIIGIQIDRGGNGTVRTLDRQTVQGNTVIFRERPEHELIGITQSLLKLTGHCFKKSFVYHRIPPLTVSADFPNGYTKKLQKYKNR